MAANVSDLLGRFHDAYRNREENPELEQTLARWEGYLPVVWADGKWRLGGFVTYLQSQLEMLRAVDPSLPVSLPKHCLDPVQIARFFGIPVEELDWPDDDPTARIERKLDLLLERGNEVMRRSELATAPACWSTQPQVQVSFHRTEKLCNVRFQRDDIHEEGVFHDILGFRCWEVLLKNPGRRLDPEELEKIAGLPPSRFRSNSLLLQR